MTPNGQFYDIVKLEEACDTSFLFTDAAANGTRVLQRRKSGLDVGNGGTDDEYDLLTVSQDPTDEDFSPLSSFSGDQPQRSATCSRYDCGSSRSSSSEELNEHDSSLYIHEPDTGNLVSPPQIEESDSELVKYEAPRLSLDSSDHSIDNAIALASIRGQGLPFIESKPKAGGSTDKSEITDRGDQLYATLKTETQTPPADPPPQGVSLQDRIFAELCQTQQEHKGFFPKGRLESLIQRDSVILELTNCLPGTASERTIAEYACKICPAPSAGLRSGDIRVKDVKSYRTVFAILVLIEQIETIGEFLDEEIHDGDLPLRKVDLPGMPRAFGLRRKNESSPPLKCFDTWKRISIINFEEWQWTVLAPFFTRGRRNDVKKYFLPDQIILPFTKDSRRQNGVHEVEDFEGGFGRVFKVEIHPDHHNFHDSKIPDSAFAIKRLNSQDMQIFQREFDMLAKFSDDAHNHLVSLLAAYKQFNAFHLIFHWADADLLRLWKLIEPSPQFTYERVYWVARQCAGLASGLFKIHRYESIYDRPARFGDTALGVADIVTRTRLYGRHGDIKPANILWFRDPTKPNDLGILKISDFGLAELHTIESRSNRPKSQVAFSKSYRPPEYDLKGGTISRSYDIWTIACLYLEFIAWLLGGWKLVKTFTITRASPGEVQSPEDRDYAFFDVENGGKSARIKKSVIDFIDKAHSHPACTEFLHEFLNMIQYDMLLIETSRLENGKRIECGKLYQKLDEMSRKCGDSQEYAMTPAAWNRRFVS